jgi:parvulin-like peptidyl-prolyl isomerase
MFSIFPYARQHNGFPKAQEAEIRRGALEMIVFEELVYQDAVKRKLTVPPERVRRAENEFRKQFSTPDEYQQYLKSELHGSTEQLRHMILRSLLIERVLKVDVESKASISPVELKAYYEKNLAKFKHDAGYSIQTISFLAPQNATSDQLRELRKRADDALRLAKATNSFNDFGMLAEKVSQDDFRVNMGDRKTVDIKKMPPEVGAALKGMKAGQVSGLIQLGPNFTIIRLNALVPAGVTSFDEVKVQLRQEQGEVRYNQIRGELNRKLKKNAKIEIL